MYENQKRQFGGHRWRLLAILIELADKALKMRFLSLNKND